MKKKKVLIITLPLRLNYGGILQAYALQKIVEGLGFEVFTDNAFFLRTLSLKEKLKDFLARFICGCIKGDDKYKPLIKKRLKRKDYEKVAKNILPFIAENIKTIDFFEGKRYPKQKNTENFDIFICGSDQVWRRKYADVRRYFFDFLNGTGKIRFSYSASFGIDDLSEYSLKEKQDCKQLIKTFSAISVREKQAMEIIKTEFDQEAVLTLDPTLLLTKEDYINLINKRDPSLYVNENENLFVYVLDKTTEKKELKNLLLRRLNLQLCEIMPQKDWKNLSSKDIDQNAIYPSVEQWLKGFETAKFILTDSFHAVVFAIIFNKPFLCIGNKERGLSRLNSLLEMFGMQNRMIYGKKDLTGILLHDIYKIDYQTINSKKETLKQISLDFLKQNLGV